MMKWQRAAFALAGLALSIGTGAPAFAAEKVVFMIDWLPAGDKAVPYLGVQKGLFADEGLDVTIQSGRGSSDVVTKLGTGAADLGTGGLAALLQARAQTPVAVKALASIYTLQPDAIFTTARFRNLDAQGCRRQDHRNRDIFLVECFVAARAQGERRRSVQGRFVEGRSGRARADAGHGKGRRHDQLGYGRSGIREAARETGKKLKVIAWSDYGFDGYGLSVFASEKILAERPETVKKFMRAYMKATAMAIADPTAAATA